MRGALNADQLGCLVDVDGKAVCMPTLCRDRLVIFCTFKAVPCPVCPEQLRRLMREPLRSFFRENLVQFVVLCPGPLEGLRGSRDELQTVLRDEWVPFICDEDLSLARAVGAEMGWGMITPGFFELRPDLNVGWSQVGRGPGNFGDAKVVRFVLSTQQQALAEAERLLHELCERLQDAQRSLESAPVTAQQRMPLPQGLLEECLQLLSPAARHSAASACREWHLSFGKAVLKDVEDCRAEVEELRDGPLRAKETEMIQEGRGRLHQAIQSTRAGHIRRGCIRKTCKDGFYEIDQVDQKDPCLEAASTLAAAFWTGVSVPRLHAVAKRLAVKLQALEALRCSGPASLEMTSVTRLEGAASAATTPSTWHQGVKVGAAVAALATAAGAWMRQMSARYSQDSGN